MTHTNVYLKFLDTEVDDVGTYTDGAMLGCSQHGELWHFSYNDIVPADFIIRLIEEHRRVMHFD